MAEFDKKVRRLFISPSILLSIHPNIHPSVLCLPSSDSGPCLFFFFFFFFFFFSSRLQKSAAEKEQEQRLKELEEHWRMVSPPPFHLPASATDDIRVLKSPNQRPGVHDGPSLSFPPLHRLPFLLSFSLSFPLLPPVHP
jgi:hypothetical protein